MSWWNLLSHYIEAQMTKGPQFAVALDTITSLIHVRNFFTPFSLEYIEVDLFSSQF